ncbi:MULTISPECIES: hypothetical protein [Stenotrophomonas]|nr:MULTISPECIES: hypothetical protein [Stenotrophomonas]
MYHNALPAALILPFPNPMPGTVADRQARRLAVLALPGLRVCPRTGNNACFMDVLGGQGDAINDVGCQAGGTDPMMDLVVTQWLLPWLLTLALLLLMWRCAPYWKGNAWVYRAGFALLAGLLTPTLMLAGHGVLPVPTVGGVVTVLLRLEWIGDLDFNLLAVGTDNIWFLFTPFQMVSIGMLFFPLRTARPARLGFGGKTTD